MEETPTETQVDSSSNKTWMMIAVAVVIVLVLGGGFLFLNQNKAVNAPATPTPTVGAMEVSPTVMEGASPSGAMMEDDKMDASAKKVSLTSAGYSPASITIKAGTKVTWTNNSGKDATVNSDPHPTHTNYPPLNLGKFSDGDSLSLTFDKPGTYGYHNHFNASEKGTVIVQ